MAIYARISQDRDGDGLGVARQLKDCRAEAARHGWAVAEEYIDDDVSAYSGKTRPAYERMLADIADGRRDAVVVWHLDRLHRRPLELEQFAEVCARAGLTDLKTVHGDIDLGNGDGLLVARLLGAVAASESDAKRRRGKRKMLEIAEAGRPHGGGRRPFGFNDDRITHRAEEAATFREIAARALAGESLTSLARWLDATGVRTVKGNPWRTPTLRELLTNPRNWGLRTHLDAEPVKAVWEPIISQADGERLRTMLLDPARRTNRTARRYLLSGLCRCGRCGAVMVSHPRGEVRRYACKTGVNQKGCNGTYIAAASLEEFIVEAVLYRLDSPEMGKALAGGVDTDEDVVRLNETVRELTASRNDFARMLANGEVTKQEWSVMRETVDSQLRLAQGSLANLTKRTAVDAYIGKADDLRRQWADLNLTRQAAIVKAVLNHVTVVPAAVRGRHGLDPDRIQPDWRL